MSSENTQYKPNICFSCQDKDRERAELQAELKNTQDTFDKWRHIFMQEEPAVKVYATIEAERCALKAENERLKRDSNKFTLYFKDKSITLMTGMGAGCVWLELEDGEGGDFEMAQLYEIIRGFYDERF